MVELTVIQTENGFVVYGAAYGQNMSRARRTWVAKDMADLLATMQMAIEQITREALRPKESQK